VRDKEGFEMSADVFSWVVERPSTTQSVVRLAGEIDMLTAPDFRGCLNAHLAEHVQHLVLDFSDVTFLGSSGLAVLLDVKTVAEQQGTKLYLVDAHSSIMRILAITGLADVFSDEPPPP
jgi:anti-sigma B factor antagonist